MKPNFQKLFNLMRKRGITAQKLSLDAKIPPSLLTKLKKMSCQECPNGSVRMDSLAKICGALHASLPEIMEIAEDKPHPSTFEEEKELQLPADYHSLPREAMELEVAETDSPYYEETKKVDLSHLPFIKIYPYAFLKLCSLSKSGAFIFRVVCHKLSDNKGINQWWVKLSEADEDWISKDPSLGNSLRKNSSKKSFKDILFRGRKELIEKGLLDPADKKAAASIKGKDVRVKKYFINYLLFFCGDRTSDLNDIMLPVIRSNFNKESAVRLSSRFIRFRKQIKYKKRIDRKDRVDHSLFIKIMASSQKKGENGIDTIFSLPEAGLAVMYLLFIQIATTPGKTSIYLPSVSSPQWQYTRFFLSKTCPQKSYGRQKDYTPEDYEKYLKNKYQRGIRACLDADIIRRSSRSDIYFVNPCFLFYGKFLFRNEKK